MAFFGSKKIAIAILLSGSMLGLTLNKIDISAYLLIVVLLRDGFLNDIFRRGSLVLNPISKYLLVILSFTAFSLLIFPITESGKQLVLAYIRIILILLLVSRVIKTFENLVSFIPYLWLILGLILIHVYSQFLDVNPFAEMTLTKWGRMLPNNISNQYVNANTYSAYISMLLGLLFAFHGSLETKMIKEVNSFRRKAALIVVFLLSMPVLGTLGSRSNIAVIVLALVVYVFKISLKRLIIFLPVLLVLFSSFSIHNYLLKYDIPLLGASTNDRIDNIFSEFSEESDRSRLSLLKVGLQVFLENPLLGVGVGHEGNEIKKRLGIFVVSHNTYINLLSELGFLGVYALIHFFSIWRRYLSSPIFMILFLVIIVYGFSHEIKAMTFAWVSMYLFWLMLRLEKSYI